MTKQEIIDILDNIDLYCGTTEISEDIEKVKDYINKIK